MFDLSGSLSDVAGRAARTAERAKIRQALELTNWNRNEGFRIARCVLQTLLTKMKDYDWSESGGGDGPIRPGKKPFYSLTPSAERQFRRTDSDRPLL